MTMKRLLPSCSLRLVAWYASSTTFVVLACMAAMFLLLQRQAEVQVDASLHAELKALINRWKSGADLAELHDKAATVALNVSELSSVAVWRYDYDEESSDGKDRVRDQRRTLAFAEAQPEPTAEVTLGDGWRTIRALAHNASGSVLIQVSRPVVSETLVWPEFQRVLMMGALGLLLICGASALLTRRAFRFVRVAIERTGRVDPRAPGKRLPVPATGQEANQLSTAINDMLDRLQRVPGKEASFATRAAHELRTPLAAQRCVGELVLQRESSPEQLREAVASMLEEGDHMHRLIDNLLLLARASSGVLQQATTAVCVETVLRRCVRSLQPLAEENGQKLRVTYRGSFEVQADETLVSQAILNLVHNAIRHTPAGTSIDVRALSILGGVCIVIADNGPGFEKSVKSMEVRDVSTIHGNRGLGLGLSIARALVRSQGGRMSLLSQPGRGTLVQLKFKVLNSLQH